jgi:hypothetical protein
MLDSCDSYRLMNINIEHALYSSKHTAVTAGGNYIYSTQHTAHCLAANISTSSEYKFGIN